MRSPVWRCCFMCSHCFCPSIRNRHGLHGVRPNHDLMTLLHLQFVGLRMARLAKPKQTRSGRPRAQIPLPAGRTEFGKSMHSVRQVPARTPQDTPPEAPNFCGTCCFAKGQTKATSPNPATIHRQANAMCNNDKVIPRIYGDNTFQAQTTRPDISDMYRVALPGDHDPHRPRCPQPLSPQMHVFCPA